MEKETEGSCEEGVGILDSDPQAVLAQSPSLHPHPPEDSRSEDADFEEWSDSLWGEVNGAEWNRSPYLSVMLRSTDAL